MPREPTFQTLHIASVAFNSLLLGEIFAPDWDMFHVIFRCHYFSKYLMTANVKLLDMILECFHFRASMTPLISMLQQEQ